MIFTRDFVTRENYWQIASLVTQKSLFTVTYALFFISLTWGPLYPGKTAFLFWDGPQVSSKAIVAKWKNLLEWRRCNIYYSRDNVFIASISLQWRHNGRDSVSNHQPDDCLLNRLFRRRSRKTSKLRVTDLCAGNSPGTDGVSAQMVSNAENVSIWWPLILSKHTKSHKNVSCLVLQLTLMNL